MQFSVTPTSRSSELPPAPSPDTSRPFCLFHTWPLKDAAISPNLFSEGFQSCDNDVEQGLLIQMAYLPCYTYLGFLNIYFISRQESRFLPRCRIDTLPARETQSAPCSRSPGLCRCLAPRCGSFCSGRRAAAAACPSGQSQPSGTIPLVADFHPSHNTPSRSQGPGPQSALQTLKQSKFCL